MSLLEVIVIIETVVIIVCFACVFVINKILKQGEKEAGKPKDFKGI